MAQLNINMKELWKQEGTLLLANPSYSVAEKSRFQRLLESSSDWPNLIWLSTSGSSSAKWVGLSRPALLSSADAVNRHLASSKEDLWVHALPDFHVGGVGIWARAYLTGAEVYDFKQREGGKWKAESFYHYLEECRGTLTALVPTQLHDLIQLQKQAPKDLRAVIIGGGHLPPSLYEQGRARGWPLLPSYGLTECGSQVATASLESLKGSFSPSLELLPHLQVCEKGGCLAFSGPSLFSAYAYLDEEEEKEEEGEGGERVHYVDPKVEGWFTTEDRGRIEGKQLHLLGRRDELVKVGGESVDLAYLEKHLQELCRQLAWQVEVTLVALPDERLGHAIHLVAANQNQGEDLERLVNAFQATVLPFERIRKIQSVPVLPRSALGKVLKKELVQVLLKI